MKCYRNITTDEVVYKEEAERYVLNRLGITVTPKGKNGEMTQEQIENIESTIDWFFSGNWIEEEIKKLEEDLFENCSNYVIPVQKVKDKIEEYKKMLLSCNRFSDVDRIKAISERILELQELLEGRK